ncbi:MAG: DUF896 domain-containing protein [Desulfotomaculum sp.]|nr:DUF896 domain-containing protein [Desulfotomaculum sp.]
MTITKELVGRINALARKQRSEGLTEDEKKEQQKLRQIYLKGIRQQVINQLELAGISKKNSCSCGCRHNHDDNHKH